MSVDTIDFDAVYRDIVDRLHTEDTRRQHKPLVRLWDGDWNLRGEVHNEIEASFTVIANETGTGTLVLPASYYLATWMTDADAREGQKNVFVTVDYKGTRWSGCLDELTQDKDDDGHRTVTAIFKHDFEHLKNIVAYSNPFLPPEVQFPRLWIMFGPARWALKLTLLVNIMRLEASLWALPDDPLDVDNWFNFDQSTWSQVVSPLSFADDPSVFAVVHSRFKNMHEVSKNIVEDAQLTWEPRRYLDGDPPPWPGANLRHGALVWDLVDHSGWDSETSFFGNIFTGLVRAVTMIGEDGITEGINYIDDPAFPDQYSQPGWLGTLPQAPGIILRDGARTGVQTSKFTWQPATAVGVVTGGHSMPGVNELISAGVQMAGDLVAMAIGLPPVGGAADAVLEPLYTDTVLAFMKWKDLGRSHDLGWSHFHESWGEGGDRAYTLSALVTLRTGLWKTRERTSHTLTVADGTEGLRVGENGRGNCYIGTRIGTTVKDWGEPGRVYVDRVSELTLSYSRTDTPAFDITIGERSDEDPIVKGLEMIQDIFGIAQELGVL